MNHLRNRGYIAGKYIVDLSLNDSYNSIINEIIKPKLYKEINYKNKYFEVDYDTKDDLIELLELSYENHNKSVLNSWEDVLPIYPISAIN